MNIEPTVASYTQGDAFQAEKRTLFASAWLPACHAAQLPEAGDFTAQSIGGWPVFAVRGKDGAVRVFRNVCRHQKMQVVEKPAGRCEELRCRYHGWTYDLAGRFVSAPDPVAPADPCAPENNLQEIPNANVGGFVLFTLGEASPPADEALASILTSSADSHAGSVTSEIGCNWKTYLEHRLSSGDSALLHWPLLVVERERDTLIVEQIVPRTFLRTRVVFHAIGGAGAAASLEARAQTLKAESEALQQQRAVGSMPDVSSGRIAHLWERLDEALAHDTGA